MTTDWSNINSVIARANQLGAGQTVFWRANGDGSNGKTKLSITHTSRQDILNASDIYIIYQTI